MIRALLLIGMTASIAIFSGSAHAEPKSGCNGGVTSVPDSLSLVCSATWLLEGKCIGSDMWDKWTITGRTNPKDSFIRPFEDMPIIVIGYELMKLQSEDAGDDKGRNSRLSWFMIGSAIRSQPDAMIWLGPGETRVRQLWPSGMGQLWPSKDKADPSRLTDMIDLHGLCFGGGGIIILLTIYFTPQSK